MKLKDALGHCDFYSEKASDIGRSLCFAGIAIIWLFKIDRAGAQKLPIFLLLPSLALALSLLCDFLQYLYGTIAWDIFHDRKEHEEGMDDEKVFYVPKKLLAPMTWLFNIKLAMVLLAYLLLVGFMGSQFF